MTALRTRMLEDMQLHGFSGSTQQGYVRSIAKLAKYYHKSPDLVSEVELRQYFLDLTQKQKVSHSTATIDLCAIKFFFASTLHRPWPSLQLMRPPKHQKLPVVLLEAGVNLRVIQCLLGHQGPRTTAIYTHLTPQVIESVSKTINQIVSAL